MKSLTIVLLMLSLHAVTGSGLWDIKESIKKCSVPKKFEGKFKASLKVGPRQVATGTGAIHVDVTIGKVANLEKVVMSGETQEINTYISNNITYVAMPASGICQKKATTTPIIPGQVPPGVTLHITRGVMHAVHVQIWEFTLKPEMGGGSETVYLTEDKCMPVRVEMKLMVHGESMYAVEDYYDMKEGIKDARVFDLPKICVKRSYYGNTHRLPPAVTLHIHHVNAKHEMFSKIRA